jgi:hypothetical protein
MRTTIVGLALAAMLAALPTPAHAADEEPTWTRKALALGGLGAGYGALYGWTFMAWHYRAVEADHIQLHEEGWFDASTYAGGADKMGHAWTNYMLTRGGARLLQASGWSRNSSLIASTTLSLGFFTLSEIKDGYNPKYGFSPNDMVANVFGSAMGVALELSPWLDERIDFRMEYLPSAAFRARVKEDGIFNGAEDYTGQTYYLAYHLGSIDTLRLDPRTAWTRWVDLSIGFHADAFSPHDDANTPRQDLFVGVSMNLQELFDPGFCHFATEVVAVPYTTLPLVKSSREQVAR